MKIALIAAGLAIGLAACEAGSDIDTETQAETGMAADTVVTERTVQDTSVVTYDTTVNVDTAEGEGAGTVSRDTVLDTRTGQTGQPVTQPMQHDTTMITTDTQPRSAQPQSQTQP